MKKIVDEVIAAYGDVKAVQARFNYSEPMAVYNWRSRGIPRYLLTEIHMDTGIPVDRLQEGAGGRSRTPAAAA